MTPDEKFEMLKQVREFIKDEVREVDLHSKPSRDTISFINELKREYNKMENQFTNQFTEIRGELNTFNRDLKELYDKVPTKDEVIIANKETAEKIVSDIRVLIEKESQKLEDHKKEASKKLEDYKRESSKKLEDYKKEESKKLEDYKREASDKFARKEFEEYIKKAIWIVITAVILSILGLVLL